MTLKLAQGWQVMLADLSLILFLTTAAALGSDGPDAAVSASGPLLAEADPVAVFRPDGGTSLHDWLATRAGDPREVVTILSRYRPGQRDIAMAQADALALEAGQSGLEPRIVVEPAQEDTTAVLVTFAADPRMARQLQSQ